ncbi:MAG: hypothetical protein QXN55_00595 [Candidatus Nitrosotenuis sp.]
MTTNVENLNVKNVVVHGTTVSVIVPPEFSAVKAFKEHVVEGLRPNKNRDVKTLAFMLVVRNVRKIHNLTGKHLTWEFLAETGKTGLYRDEKGHFTKRDF